MKGVLIIEIAISLIFTYLMLSIVVCGIVEILNKWTRKRGKMLQQALEKVLNDPANKNWADMLYNHPLIGGLKRDYKSLPHYISSNLFSSVILDLVINEGKDFIIKQEEDGVIKYIEKANDKEGLDKFIKGINSLNESEFKTILKSFLIDSPNVEALKTNIAKWFDEYMDRLTGWFKWDMKKLSLYVAIGLTVAFNIDSLGIIKEIKKNDAVRAIMVADAERTLNSMKDVITTIKVANNETLSETQLNVSADTTDPVLSEDLTKIKGYLNRLDILFYQYELPIGWPEKKTFCKESSGLKCFWSYRKLIGFRTIIGWLITILALTLGAPFWFNALNSLVNMRNSGLIPQKVKKENI